MNPALFGLALVSISLNAGAQLALRKAMLTIGQQLSTGFIATFVSALGNIWFFVGMGCYVISIGIWLVVLSRVEVSLAYPLLSIGYVIAAVAGFFLLGESVGPTRIAGIAVICLGIFLISRSA